MVPALVFQLNIVVSLPCTVVTLFNRQSSLTFLGFKFFIISGIDPN